MKWDRNKRHERRGERTHSFGVIPGKEKLCGGAGACLTATVGAVSDSAQAVGPFSGDGAVGTAGIIEARESLEILVGPFLRSLCEVACPMFGFSGLI